MRGFGVVCALLSAACGPASSGPEDGGAPPVLDARGADLDGTPADAGSPPPPGDLILGRCVLPSGETCTGAADEQGSFETVEDRGVVEMVVGPQGSTMFVLAARTHDIDPGDPTRPFDSINPLVEVSLSDAMGAELGSLRTRAPFSADEALPGVYVNASLFVVVDTRVYAGTLLRVDATLEDASGQHRAGALRFTAEVAPVSGSSAQ